jgi:hypothetical protein
MAQFPRLEPPQFSEAPACTNHRLSGPPSWGILDPMRPLGTTAIVLAAALAGCSSTRTAERTQASPPPEEAQAYYPLEAGWRWAYDLEKGDERILATYTVSEVVGDTAIVTGGEERLLYAVLPEGVARKEGLSVGDFILRSPIRNGAEWPVTGGKARVTAVGKTVTVPAGDFENCAVVEEVRTSPDRVLRTTYAAGVGPVLLEYQVHDGASDRFEVALRATLRGVTRPGEDPLGP